MKNRIITYILLGVLGVLPLTSCSDYLDKMPDDQLTLENCIFQQGQSGTLAFLSLFCNAGVLYL